MNYKYYKSTKIIRKLLKLFNQTQMKLNSNKENSTQK